MRATMFAAAAALALSGPALAQPPIATAPTGGAAMPQPTGSPALPTPETAREEGQPVAFGPCGPEKVKPDGRLDTAPHGEVEADVGTGGYRRAAGMVCQPIGQSGSVAVGLSRTQDDGRYYGRR